MAWTLTEKFIGAAVIAGGIGFVGLVANNPESFSSAPDTDTVTDVMNAHSLHDARLYNRKDYLCRQGELGTEFSAKNAQGKDVNGVICTEALNRSSYLRFTGNRY